MQQEEIKTKAVGCSDASNQKVSNLEQCGSRSHNSPTTAVAPEVAAQHEAAAGAHENRQPIDVRSTDVKEDPSVLMDWVSNEEDEREDAYVDQLDRQETERQRIEEEELQTYFEEMEQDRERRARELRELEDAWA